MNTPRVDELLLDLYACTSNRSGWPRVLDRICRATGSRSAVIQFLVRDGERAWSKWVLRDSTSEADCAEHERYMGDDVNPRLNYSRQREALPTQHVFRDRDFFASDDPVLPEIRDRLAAIHLGHFMSVSTVLPGNARLALVLHKDLRERRDFEPDHESFALGLIPHLTQVMRLTERIEDSQKRTRDLEDALDLVRCPLVLCDPDSRVRWANKSAQEMFDRANRIHVSGERLVAPTHEETLRLRKRIEQIAKEDQPARLADRCLVLGSGSTTALQVMMHAIPGEAASSLSKSASTRRVLLVLSSPTEIPTLPADLIGRVFTLSPAESRVAAALCRGVTINEYASATGITIGTARFHLKQVLAKTQSSRQSDLVRQICSSVIARAFPNGDTE